MIRGIELLVLRKERSFELRWEGGGYLDNKGRPIEDLMDMACFSCGGAYYTTESEGIEFCPHCGNFERKSFKDYEELRAWARGQDWTFVKELPARYFAAFEGGRWGMRVGRNIEELQRTRRYDEVRPLMDDLVPA